MDRFDWEETELDEVEWNEDLTETFSPSKKRSWMRPLFLLALLTFLGIGGIFLLYRAGALEKPAWMRREQMPEGECRNIPQQHVEKLSEADMQAYKEEFRAKKEQRKDKNEEKAGHPDGERQEASVGFIGDFLFDPGYSVGSVMASSGGFAPCIDGEALQIMRETDLLIANNEFPYTAAGAPLPEKKFTFHAPPETAGWLHDAGIDVAALANNHCYDYGERGFLDTLQALDNAGIPYIGAGRDLEEAVRPWRQQFGGTKVAVINATQIEQTDHPDTKGAEEGTPGVFRCFDPGRMYDAVRKEKEQSDVVIVFIHWGTEKEEKPDWLQLQQAKGLAEAGADLVVGAHPHRVQPIDVVDGMPVAYSIGNFLFTSYRLETAFLQVRIDCNEKKIKDLRYVPMAQENNRAVLLRGDERENALQRLRDSSGKIRVDEEGFITY